MVIKKKKKRKEKPKTLRWLYKISRSHLCYANTYWRHIKFSVFFFHRSTSFLILLSIALSSRDIPNYESCEVFPRNRNKKKRAESTGRCICFAFWHFSNLLCSAALNWRPLHVNYNLVLFNIDKSAAKHRVTKVFICHFHCRHILLTIITKNCFARENSMKSREKKTIIRINISLEIGHWHLNTRSK